MNHMDENYWKNLANQWIKNKTQEQQQSPIPDFSNRNNFSLSVPPDPPNIGSYLEPSKSDNHAVADMDIEDFKEDEPEKLWNWQSSNFEIQQPHQHQLPAMHSFAHVHHHHPQQIQQNYHNPTFTKAIPILIPEPPSLKSTFSHSHSDDGASNNLVDMDMDNSDDNEGDDSNSNSASSGMMDARKKKILPIWIREGLEKMKREKELEIAREQEEMKLKEEAANRKKIMEEALLEIEHEKASKSKYESESESEDDDSKLQKTDKIVPKSDVASEPPVIELNDEEAYENMMLLVRKTLTSILLEVTNEKIQEISSETLSKYRKKASTTQSKPAIIGLGLGVYSSSSDEDSDADEKERSDQSDWEPESVLKERIRQKEKTFEKRSKDVEEKLSKIAEMEDVKYNRKKDNTNSPRNDHDENSDHDGGEEKYDTKVTSSSAGNSRTREKKTRFSDPKEGRSVTLTHVNLLQGSEIRAEIAPIALSSIYPPQSDKSSEKGEKSKKSKRRSSSSSSSGSSSNRKKHKKHKKSSKHSKKSSKKKERSRSPPRHHKTDRKSIESKSSARSSESRSRHSRSRSRDRHRRRY